MNQATQKNKEYLWLLLLVVIIIIGFFALRFISRIWPLVDSSNNYPQVEYKLIDRRALSDLRALKVCGSWPIRSVNLSNQRGNPFVQSATDKVTAPQLATSSVDCVPLGQ